MHNDFSKLHKFDKKEREKEVLSHLFQNLLTVSNLIVFLEIVFILRWVSQEFPVVVVNANVKKMTLLLKKTITNAV